MAGIAAAALISVGAAGVGKLKAHHSKRKARRALITDATAETTEGEATERLTREDNLATAKAREASEERRRRVDEDEAAEAAVTPPSPASSPFSNRRDLGVHPALRSGNEGRNTAPRQPVVHDAPPPYVRDAPRYEEHYSHPIAAPEPLPQDCPAPQRRNSLLGRAATVSGRRRRRDSMAAASSSTAAIAEADERGTAGDAAERGRPLLQHRRSTSAFREMGALMRDGQQIDPAGYPVGERPRSPPRAGETEEQRRERKRKEFFDLRKGKFFMLMGAMMAI